MRGSKRTPEPIEEKRPRGRPRSPRKAGQRATLSLRITAELFQKLDAEAKQKGRALSNEAETRLERSFEEDRVAAYFSDAYFGRELAALLEIIGRAMRDAGTHATALEPGDGSQSWLDSPYAFAVAVEAAMRVLHAVRPPGEIKTPRPRIPAERRLGEA